MVAFPMVTAHRRDSKKETMQKAPLDRILYDCIMKVEIHLYSKEVWTMEKEIKRLGDAELEIMLAVWAAAAPVQSGYVQQHLRRSWPLPAVVTAMNRLVDKGFLSREKEGRVNLYRPLISEEDYKTAEGRGVLHRLYGDSVAGLVTALYDGKAIGEEDLRELRAFLDGLEGK